MNTNIIAAVVGLVSAVVASIVTGYVGYRRLRSELRAQTRQDYMQRQMSACEELWRHLLPLSEYPTSKSILLSQRKPFFASPARAHAFCEDITAIFFSPAGLYISRDVRYSLFRMRTLLSRELVKGSTELDESVAVSNTFVKRYRFYASQLYRSIRTEVGAIDLKVVREGPLE